MRSISHRRRTLLGLLATAVMIPLVYRVVIIYRWRPGVCTSGTVQTLTRQPARPSPGNTLRIGSWNIEGHAALFDAGHIDEIARVIRSMDVDAIALQEVHRGTWQSRFRDQLAELSAKTGMTAIWTPSYASAGEFGNAILTRGEVLATTATRLPGIGEPRSMLVATLRIDGRTIRLATTHLTSWSRLARSSRMQQVDCVRSVLRDEPVILAGDLNAEPSSDELASLVEDGFAYSDAMLQPTHRILETKIDYLLNRGIGPVSGFLVHDTDASDHRPVTLELGTR